MKILRRYILREHIGPFVAALGVSTGLMLLNQLAKRFGDLVGKGLPWYVIGEVFGLSVPFIVAMTMPMAVLVAVLYTFSRLSGDNEITAVKAGGVGLTRIIFPVLVAATVIAAGMVVFNDRLLPESNHKLRTLLSDIARKRPTFELRERVVNEVVDGKLFLQAARIERMRSVLWDLVIFDVGRPNTNRTIYADSGHMAFNEAQTDLYLTLYDGSMHELDTDKPSMAQRTYYAKQVIRVLGVTNELERGRSADWRGDREMNISMMQEEVANRRDRIRELADTLDALMTLASPIRTRSPGDTAVETIPLDIPSEEDSRVVDEEPRPGDVSARDRAPERPAPRADQDAAASGDEVERSPVTTREIRDQLRYMRRLPFPPDGQALSFATVMRGDLERIASRRQLQRRELSRYAVEIQKKFAIPVAAIVFVLIGAPIGIRFPRGGIGMVIGVSFTVFCVYYVFLIGGEELADRNFLSPFWAMWTPNVLFAALGIVILFLVSRSGSRRVHPVLARLRGLPPPRRRQSSGDAEEGRAAA
ncbi:MAG: LptF/LptG family permease [Gemmatimonadota bacterium]|nr:MAG: LptF/LptG family permease [Gemmatimonadota bacterium]